MHKNGMRNGYISDGQFRSRARALMVLPLFPRNKIVSVYKNLEGLFPSDDNDISKLYSYFGGVWIRSIPNECLSQYDSLFITDNDLESFLATLSGRILDAHPEFFTFADTVHRITSEAMLKLQTQ